MDDANDEAPFTERMQLSNGMMMRWVRSDGWYVGQPEAISQGRTLENLVDMILDAKATLEGEVD